MKRQLFHFIFVLLAIFAVQAQELTVCTYNVRYKNGDDTDAGNGWNTRRTYLINLVNFQQPDLLGVQEALPAQMTDLKNGLTDYGTIGVGRNDGANSGEYSAIFYRKERMVLIDHGDFWLSDTPYKPSKGFPSQGGGTSYYRICTWGKFYDKATGVTLFHFNTHMDLDETNRQQSFYLIKQKIQELASTTAPVIISGDYNAVQTGDAYKLFLNSGFLIDSFEKAKQKFMTNGTCPGFNSESYSTVSGQLRRIDHIFVTKNAFNVNSDALRKPRRKAKPFALFLYILLAIPLTICAIAVLLVPALLFLALSVAVIICGVVLVSTAFKGFAVFADIMVVLGLSMVLFALGLLFLWTAIWFVGGAIVGVVHGVAVLCEKWCYKEVLEA